MKLCFMTDNHLGKTAAANTTAASQAAMREHLFYLTMDLLDRAEEREAAVYQLGDLFDRHTNNEAVILQGLQVMRRVRRGMAGNHDLLNVKGSISSLKLVEEALRRDNKTDHRIVISPDGSKPYHFSEHLSGTDVSISFVPHCFTQEVFAQSLRELCSDIAIQAKRYRILCLHCNVNEGFGRNEAEGSTLNLTEELQELVAQHFDLTLVGHEHEARTLQNGKIVILGNTFPVSFGELSDRYIYWFDTTTKELTKECIFEAARSVDRVPVELLLESPEGYETDAVLLEVTGTVNSIDYPNLSRAIAATWKANKETLLAFKNSVEIIRPNSVKKANDDPDAPVRPTIKQMVEDSIKSTEFSAEYEEIADELGGPE